LFSSIYDVAYGLELKVMSLSEAAFLFGRRSSDFNNHWMNLLK